MKKILIPLILLAMVLTGCSKIEPQDTVIKGQFGEQYEKRPIRMMNIDGVLYYDSGLESDKGPRCGTLDGNIKKTVGEGEIPKNSGECNFDGADGYQNATGITKEVPIDGRWVIFKKYDGGLSSGTGELKYCFYIKGRLNNAARDNELVVLAEKKDITFSDVYEPMLSSQLNAGKENGCIAFVHFSSGDEWGITLKAKDVTKTGLTVVCERFGGYPTGELTRGDWYSVEICEDGKWKKAETVLLEELVGWHAVAYTIPENEISEYKVDWKWLYGELSPGYYRLNTEITDFRGTGNYDDKIYSVYFNIE